MLTKEELPYCPVAVTVRVIGNKWKLLLIRNLLSAPQRFTELKKGVTGISQKVLTENLRSLERDGIVRREVFAEIPPKVVYSLTARGKSLMKVLVQLCTWGENNRDWTPEE